MQTYKSSNWHQVSVHEVLTIQTTTLLSGKNLTEKLGAGIRHNFKMKAVTLKLERRKNMGRTVSSIQSLWHLVVKVDMYIFI